MKRISAAAIVGAICMTLGTMIYFCLVPGTGMALKLQQVPAFSRSAAFIATFHRNKGILMNVSNDNKSSYHEFNLGPIYDSAFLPPAAIAVRPDGSRFYICIDEMLGEYDSSGKLLRKIAIDKFGFKDTKFGQEAQASNDCVWFTAGDVIVEWESSKPAHTCVLGPSAFVWTVDPAGHIVFLRGPKDGIFDFGTMEFDEKLWNEYGLFCDFAEARGLLLSNVLSCEKDDTIVLMNLEDGEIKELSWGAQAQWGPDGYIYFVRGNTQLWRYKPSEYDAEPVYLATKLPQGDKEGYLHVLKLSHDRTFLAFYFWCRPSADFELKGITVDPKRHGLVLIDLKKREYIEIKGESLRPIENMAWLVKAE
jgi:hypothetical protein